MTTKDLILKSAVSAFVVVLLFSFVAFTGLVASQALVWVFVVLFVLLITFCGVLAVRSSMKKLPRNSTVFRLKAIISAVLLSVIFTFVFLNLLSVIVLNLGSVLVFVGLFTSLIIFLIAIFIAVILFSHKNQIPVKLRVNKKYVLIGGAFLAAVAVIALLLWAEIQKGITSLVIVYMLFITPLVEGVIGVMLAASWICDSSKDLQKKHGGVATSKKKERKRLSEEDFGNNYEEKHRATFSEEADINIDILETDK